MRRIAQLVTIIVFVTIGGFGNVSAQEPSLTSMSGVVETKSCNLTPRKAARDLTGDVANSVHFFKGSSELRYLGPEVLVRVKRDYMVFDYQGGVYLQHRKAVLSSFGVFCYDRPLDVPYTSTPARGGCLKGLSEGTTSEKIQWLVDNLGGWKSRWLSWGSSFHYKARKAVLFTMPLDAQAWLYDKEFMATPGYQVYSRNFLLYCYPFEG